MKPQPGYRVNTLGQTGEQIAADYLTSKGLRIMARNFRRPWGEIDLVLKDPRTKEIIFVEVKTTGSKNQPSKFAPEPYDQMTTHKIKRLKKIFISYLSLNRYDENQPWRFDAIFVKKCPEQGDYVIEHLKDIYLDY